MRYLFSRQGKGYQSVLLGEGAQSNCRHPEFSKGFPTSFSEKLSKQPTGHQKKGNIKTSFPHSGNVWLPDDTCWLIKGTHLKAFL